MARSILSLLAIYLTAVATVLGQIDYSETSQNVNCTQDGFLPHAEDCKSFYWCSLRRKLRAIILECESDQIFDTQTQSCTYPWMSTREECGGTLHQSNEVDLDESSLNIIPQFENLRSGYRNLGSNCAQEGFLPHEDDCRKFYRCIDQGKGKFLKYEFSCGEGTVWDPDINACNHPWATRNSKCTGKNVTTEQAYPVNEASDHSSNVDNPNPSYPSYPEPQPSYPNYSEGGQLPQQGSSNPNYPNYQNPEVSEAPSSTYNPPTYQEVSSQLPENNNENINQQPLEPFTDNSNNAPNNPDNECREEDFLGDSKDCRKFYRCVQDGKGGFAKYEFSCGKGTVWDPDIKSCNHEWATKNTNCRIGDTVTSSSSPVSLGEYDPDNPNNQERPKPISSSSPSYPHNNYPSEIPPNYPENPQPISTSSTSYPLETSSNPPPNYSENTNKPTTSNSYPESGYNEISSTLTNPNYQETSTKPSEQLSSSSLAPSTTESSSEAHEQSQNKCTKEDFIPDPKNCNKFIRCVDNGREGFTKYEFTCGKGTVWDTNTKTCNHPSQTRTKCGTEEETTNLESSTEVLGPSTTSTEKPLQEISEPQTSTEGLSTSTPASSTLSFEQTSSSSTSIEQSSSSPTKEASTETSNKKQFDECRQEGFIGDSKDCKKFYRCIENGKQGFTKYEFTCGEGTVWDVDQLTCNHPADTRRQCRDINDGSKKPEGDKQQSSSEKGQELSSTESTSTISSSNEMNQESSSISSTGIPEEITDKEQSSTQTAQETATPSTIKPDETSNTSSESNTEISIAGSSTTTISTADPNKQTDVCKKDGFMPNSKDCRKFYRCVGNNKQEYTKYEFSCGDGTIWDPDLDTCNFPSVVRNNNCVSGDGSKDQTTTQSSTGSEETNVNATEQAGQPTEIEKGTTIMPIDQTTISSSSEWSSTENSTTGSSSFETSTSEIITSVPTTTEENEKELSTVQSVAQTETSSQSFTQSETTTQTSSSPSEQVEISSESSSTQTTSTLPSETSSSVVPESSTQSPPPIETSNQSETTSAQVVTSTEISNQSEITSQTSAETSQSSSLTEIPTQSQSTSQAPSSTEKVFYNENVCSQEGFFPNVKDCNKFYRCVSNGNGFTKYDFSCGPGTIWDPDLTTCNHPYAVSNKACEKGNSSSEGNEKEKPQNKCTGEGFYPHSQDCKRFFRCVSNGQGGYSKYDFNCGDGTVFDSNLQTCNHPEAAVNEVCGHKAGPKPTTEKEIIVTESSTTTLEITTPDDKIESTTGPITDTTAAQQTTDSQEQTTTDSQQQTTDFQQQTTTDSQQQTTTDSQQQTTTDSQEQTTESLQQTTDYPQTTTEILQQTTIDSQQTTTGSQQQTTDLLSTSPEQTTILTTANPESTTNFQTTTIDQATEVEKEISTISLSTEETTISTTTEAEQQSTAGTTTEIDLPSTTPSEITTEENKEITATSEVSITEGLTSTTDTTEQTSVITETSLTTTEQSTTTFSPTTDLTVTSTESSTDSDFSTLPPERNQTTAPCPIAELEGDQITLVCPTGFKRHPKYCNMFYQCTNNPETMEVKILVISCPVGTIFDDQKIQCLSPDETEQKCKGQISEKQQFRNYGTRSALPMEIETTKPLCPYEGTYPISSNKCLNNFIRCQPSPQLTKVRGYIHQCPSNYTYWPISRRCEKQSPGLGCSQIQNFEESFKWMIPIEIENVSRV